MHCPRCGHSQPLDETRFCTKCGLPLGEVKEILTPETSPKHSKPPNRIAKGLRQGVGLMVFGFFLITILAILRDLIFLPEITIKLAALIFCVGGAMRMIYPYLTGGNSPRKKAKDPAPSGEAAKVITGKATTQRSLPEGQLFPAADLAAKKYKTAELVSRPSVTEDTTNRLDDRLEHRSE